MGCFHFSYLCLCVLSLLLSLIYIYIWVNSLGDHKTDFRAVLTSLILLRQGPSLSLKLITSVRVVGLQVPGVCLALYTTSCIVEVPRFYVAVGVSNSWSHAYTASVLPTPESPPQPLCFCFLLLTFISSGSAYIYSCWWGRGWPELAFAPYHQPCHVRVSYIVLLNDIGIARPPTSEQNVLGLPGRSAHQ